MISVNTIKAITAIAKVNKPFYARDFHLDGSAMSAMSAMHIIEKTGNQTEEFLALGDDFYKKVPAYEWKVNTAMLKFCVSELKTELEVAVDFLETINELF